jgi:pyrroloquinoline quinone (PQQ) biosynthesis protein C
MNFHPFNQCWRWDKQSDLKMWLNDRWAIVDDWIIQRSKPYHRMRQQQHRRALLREMRTLRHKLLGLR